MMYVKGEPYRTNLPSTMQLKTMRAVKQTWGLKWAFVFDFINNLDADRPLLELIDEDVFLAWMWGWMRNAGSEITREEMLELTPEDIDFRPNDDPAVEGSEDEAGEASPTEAPNQNSSSKGSGRGASAKAAAGRKQAAKKRPASSGTTSK